jgi:hypothetical protein
VNPLQLHLPRGEAVRADWIEDFTARIGPARQRLDEVPVAAL